MFKYWFDKCCLKVKTWLLISKQWLAKWILRAINWFSCLVGHHDPLFVFLNKDKEAVYQCEHCGCGVTYADGRWFKHENNTL